MDARIRFGVRFLPATLAACALASSPASAAPAPAQAVRVGSAPVLPSGAQTVAAIPGAKRLRLTMALKPRNAGRLESLATEVSTPSSPLFRHYLSVAQFSQSFGASAAQIAIVQSALHAQGLSVGVPLANDLTLPVTGSASQVEKALSVSLSQVKLPSGRTAYANAQAPSIPAEAAQFVQGVIGLDDIAPSEPQKTSPLMGGSGSVGLSKPASNVSGSSQIATGGPQPCLQASELAAFEGGYTADTIASAYQFSSLYIAGDLGAGQTIAVFEQQPFQPSDIATYQACYGTSATVTPVDVDEGPGPYAGEDTEAALDIEQIVGLAPQAHVLVYQGPEEQSVAPVDIISRMVSDDTAKVISSSWGECEDLTVPSVIASENTLLQEAAAQGQSFFVSSGDSGSTQCSQVQPSNHSISVLNPASQPFATGVGGTTLFSRSEGQDFRYDGSLPPTEGVWNDGPRSSEGGGGTGGGISDKWAMPSYQSNPGGPPGVINGHSSSVACGQAPLCREVPDVSANADEETGYVVFTENAWRIVGGTSASAPLWAAFTGLANSSAACRGNSVGFANPSLYGIAGSNYAGNFRDVTEASPISGFANNNIREGATPGALYPLTAGYDMATGIGAPIGPALATSLCALGVPVEAPAQAAAPPVSSTTVPAAATTPNAVLAGPTATQLAAQLAKLLAPSGKGAKLAALLKAGGLTISFKALSAGSVAIGWYELPKGAKLAKKAKPKPVLVASAQLKFTAPGSRTIKIKLTPAGKRLLKHAKQVKLTGKGTFTPVGKPPVSAIRSFLLRR
jgi:subtilase family serine protease